MLELNVNVELINKKKVQFEDWKWLSINDVLIPKSYLRFVYFHFDICKRHTIFKGFPWNIKVRCLTVRCI